MYLVAVTFHVRADRAADFMARVRRQAEDSLTEPGCHRFDVWCGPEGAQTVFLYEIYEDRAAFEAHLASEHFKAFDAEVADWVADKRVETALLTPA